MVLEGDSLFTMNAGEDTVSVLDTKTDVVHKTLTVGDAPLSATVVGKKIYVNNSKSKFLSFIQTTAPTLLKFTSTTPNGTYTEEKKLRIDAIFDQTL